MRVVRLGSAKAAANELALSPSALSRRVAALEDFTGKRLFTRQHQAMKLTDEGQAFYNAIAPKLEELAQAVEAQVDRGQVLRLHLGVPSLFGGQRLFPRLPELRKLHPRLHIDIDTAAHLEDRVGDTLDAAIVLTKEPDPAFYRVQLDHNNVYAIVSRELAAEIGQVPDRKVLSKQTFMIHQDLPDSLDAWKKAIGMPDLEPAAIDKFDSGQLVLEAAAQGLVFDALRLRRGGEVQASGVAVDWRRAEQAEREWAGLGLEVRMERRDEWADGHVVFNLSSGSRP